MELKGVDFTMVKIILIACFSISLQLNNCYCQDSIPSQNLLVIRKVNKSKRVYYQENTPILYKANDTLRYSTIFQIENDSMLADTTWIKYDDIQYIINPYGRNFLKQGSVLFPIAGIAFTILTTFNAIINRDKPIFYREHLIPSVGLVGLGAIMWPFKTQKYRLKRKWELIVMPS